MYEVLKDDNQILFDPEHQSIKPSDASEMGVEVERKSTGERE